MILEVGGGDHHTGGAADGPDAVLFKLATFIHMYFCILHFLTLRLVLPFIGLHMEINCIVRSRSILSNSLEWSMLSGGRRIGLESLGC